MTGTPTLAPRRVVLADDEPLARDRLRQLLARRPAYQVVAECRDGSEAVDAILREHPDLVFLDVAMPGLDGLEVAEAVADEPPVIIFVTAYNEFALRAFEVSAVDYLLKPVDRERFDRALARAEATFARGSAAGLDAPLRNFLERLRAERAYPRRFLVRATRGHYFVRVEDVDWVAAEGNYVALHAGGRAHLVRDTMKAFEGKLNPESFVRVHRSAIVNIDRVERIEPRGHGEYALTLRGGARLESSRAYSDRLQALLR